MPHSFDRPDPLISDLLRGDTDALRALYDRDSAWIYGLALKFVDPESAQAVVMDLFARLEHEPASGVYPGLSHRGRVIRMLREMCLARRAEGRAQPAASVDPGPADTPIRRALEAVDAGGRRLLMQVFWSGATPQTDRRALRRTLRALAPMLPSGLRTPADSADGLAAAEMALGALAGDDAQVIDQRMLYDDALAATCGAWTEALSQLALPLRPVAAPASLRGRVVGAARVDKLRGVLSDLDVIPTVLGAVAAMLVAAAMLWVAQGGLRRAPDALQAVLTGGDPAVTVSVSYQPDERRMAVYADAATPAGSWIALKIGADPALRLGQLAPPPQISVLAVPQTVSGNLEGALLILSIDDREIARAPLLPRE